MRKMLSVTLALVMVLSLMGGVAMAEEHVVDTDYEEEYLAAPAVAELLLKEAGVANRYGKGRTGGNYISDVAREMGPGTKFNDIEKTDVVSYRNEISKFLGLEPDTFEAELESVWYEGDFDKFGSEAGETLTLTFSNDVFFDGDDQVDAKVFVDFKDASSLGYNESYMTYTIDDNKVIITSVVGFGSPRPEIGDFVVGIDGILDADDNPVIVPDDGVIVEGDEMEPEAVITMNHELLDTGNPEFLDAGGYFLNMGFEVNRDLDLTDETVQFIAYYEYKINEEVNIVENEIGDPFVRSKEWGFIRYGDLINPEAQPDVLEAGTQYFFTATGDTNYTLYSLAELAPGTEYEVRVVYLIDDDFTWDDFVWDDYLDDSAAYTKTYSPWIEYTR